MVSVSRGIVGAGVSPFVLVIACADGPGPGLDGADTSTSLVTDSGVETGMDTPTAGTEPTTGDTTTDETAGEAVCCGCLCVDPAWSCAVETCVDAAGKAVALAPEAGFLALAPYSFSSVIDGEETAQTTPEARIWYMFRPADEQPETRPLAVLFNGGPGYSSAILFGLNTNAVTLDPDVAGDEVVVANPHRWTRFANVLYIDPREAGYSYDIMPEGPKPWLEFSPERDAADIVRVVLAFLARHPKIEKNPVMLVGESYGANRSALMLGQILFPERLVSRPRYRDPGLRDALLEHLAVVFPEESPDGLTPEVIARQFGHQVMIQPALTWLDLPGVTPTPDEQQFAERGCVAEPDVAQCDEPAMWSSDRTAHVFAALRDPVHLAAALGVDPTTIAWMYADARAAAVPRGWNGQPEDEHALRAVFGELSIFEDYYHGSAGGGGVAWQSGFYVQAYLETLYYTRTFITDAGKDAIVHAPDVPRYLAATKHVVAAAVHDKAPRPGEARPGWIRLSYVPEIVPGAPERDIRFPHYPIGGHMVSHKQGAELAEDVCRWWLADCPLP